MVSVLVSRTPVVVQAIATKIVVALADSGEMPIKCREMSGANAKLLLHKGVRRPIPCVPLIAEPPPVPHMIKEQVKAYVIVI